MKSSPFVRILLGVAILLILVGGAPFAYLLLRGATVNAEPLSMPISLRQGEYASTFFSADPKLSYQVEIYFLPPHRTPLELDWKIVDESGMLIQSGTWDETHQMGGNDAILERNYRPKGKSPQRIIVSIQQGIQETNSDTKLHIGIPEIGLQESYGLAAAIIWMIFFAGTGIVLLLVLAVRRWARQTRLAQI